MQVTSWPQAPDTPRAPAPPGVCRCAARRPAATCSSRARSRRAARNATRAPGCQHPL